MQCMTSTIGNLKENKADRAFNQGAPSLLTVKGESIPTRSKRKQSNSRKIEATSSHSLKVRTDTIFVQTLCLCVYIRELIAYLEPVG